MQGRRKDTQEEVDRDGVGKDRGILSVCANTWQGVVKDRARLLAVPRDRARGNGHKPQGQEIPFKVKKKPYMP